MNCLKENILGHRSNERKEQINYLKPIAFIGLPIHLTDDPLFLDKPKIEYKKRKIFSQNENK